LRKQIRREPDFFAPELAFNRWDYATRTDGSEGLDALHEAMLLLQGVAEKQPAQFLGSWINCTRVLMRRLRMANQAEKALEICKEIRFNTKTTMANRSWKQLSEFYEEVARCYEARRRPLDRLAAIGTSVYWLGEGANYQPRVAGERFVLRTIQYAELLMSLGRLAEAQTEADRALGIIPQLDIQNTERLKFDAVDVLSRVQLRSGNYTESLRLLEQAIVIANHLKAPNYKNLSACYLNLARALTHLDRPFGSLDATLQALKLMSQWIDPEMEGPAAAVAASQLEQATTTLEKIRLTRRHAPLIEQAQVNLAVLTIGPLSKNSERDLKDAEAALNAMQRALDRLPAFKSRLREAAILIAIATRRIREGGFKSLFKDWEL